MKMNTVRVLAGAGFLLFALPFMMTLLAPVQVERMAQDFLRAQVESEVRDRLGALEDSGFTAGARRLAEHLKLEQDAWEAAPAQDLPARIAAVVARMQDLDCECRRQLQDRAARVIEWRVASLAAAQDRLLELIEGQYAEVVTRLQTELRIFAGANAAVFLFLLLAASLRPQALAQLWLPAILLMLSTGAAAGIYLFAQNWFYTLLFNSYVGYGYLAYLAVSFGLLLDVVLNRARITTELVGATVSAVGKGAAAC